MKIISRTRDALAFTALELLVIVAVLAVLAALLLSALNHADVNTDGIQCENNLKQVGLSFRIWSGDNNELFPMQVSTNEGGTREFLAGTNVFAHFRALSNELNTPKVVVCPYDKKRTAATNFISEFDNSHLSYFLGVDAGRTNATMLLSGDRHITTGLPLKDGVLELTANQKVWWAKEMHKGGGNVLLADGSVLRPTTTELKGVLAKTGVITNRLAFP